MHARTLLLLVAILWTTESLAAQSPVTYEQPPKCLIWLEGEDCEEHNWAEGPARACWAFDWSGIHGGVLDLASWRLPEGGRYYARFRFGLTRPGEYVAYYLGRVPGYLASPVEWSVDDASPVEVATYGQGPKGHVVGTKLLKYGVTRLGQFTATAGRHVLTISVTKSVDDWGHSMYSQQIDAIGIAPASWPVEPRKPPAPAGKPMSAVPRPSPVDTPVLDDPGASAVRFHSNGLELLLSPVNAGIRSIVHRGPQRISIARCERAAPVLRADFMDGTASHIGRVKSASQEHGRLKLRLSCPKVDAELSLLPDEDSGEIRLISRVLNKHGSPIWRIQLFACCGMAMRGRATDDSWVVAQDILAPHQVVGRHCRGSPRSLSFDWVCITDSDSAFYAFFQDESLLDTELEFGKEDGSESRASLAFSKFPRILPGRCWTAPPLVLGAYPKGDWRPAADRFSAWWHSWASSPTHPDWVKRMGGMTVGLEFHGEKAIEQCRERVRRVNDATGITCFHGAGWIFNVTECWYPVQYRLSAEKLSRMRSITDTARANGGRTSIYTNALMVSRAAQDYELWGKGLAAAAMDGGTWFTEHHAHHHPMYLPYPNAAWGERFASIVEQPLLRGQPDMLYMDQLGAVPSHLDFAPERHGHDHYGEWTSGSVGFVKRVRERLCGSNPGLATAIECPCPALLQYVDLSMYGTTRVLRYVFPTYRGFVGRYSGVSPEEALELARTALLRGEPLLLLNAELEKADDETRRAVRQIVVLKQHVDPLLYDARYRDTLGLSVTGDAKVSVFVGESGILIPFARVKASGPSRIICDCDKLGFRPKGKCCYRAVRAPGQLIAIPASYRADGMLELSVPDVSAGLISVE